MEVIYTIHAEEKLLEREFEKSAIEETLEKPDRIFTSRLGRMIAQKAMEDRSLRVVYEVEGSVYIVITAYYTKRGRYE